MREPTAEVFLKDVAEHAIKVLHADGIYRHVRFKKPGDSNFWFDLITWPGCLTIRGDMGTWVFSRVEDMFTFFRVDELKINPSYWAEKIQNGVHGGQDTCKVFSAALFKEQVLNRLGNWDLSTEALEHVKFRLGTEVFTDEEGYFGEYEHYRKLWEFNCNGVQFDCELPDGKHHNYHFVWCLYAIVWGIQQWDAMQSAGERPAETPIAKE